MVTSGAKAHEVLTAGTKHTVDRKAGDLAEQITRHSGGRLDAVSDIAEEPDGGRTVAAGAR